MHEQRAKGSPQAESGVASTVHGWVVISTYEYPNSNEDHFRLESVVLIHQELILDSGR